METPGRARRPRKSIIPSERGTEASDETGGPEVVKKRSAKGYASNRGQANGSAVPNGHAEERVKVLEEEEDPRIDYTGHLEFGGSWGVSAMMIGFPL